MHSNTLIGTCTCPIHPSYLCYKYYVYSFRQWNSWRWLQLYYTSCMSSGGVGGGSWKDRSKKLLVISEKWSKIKKLLAILAAKKDNSLITKMSTGISTQHNNWQFNTTNPFFCNELWLHLLLSAPWCSLHFTKERFESWFQWQRRFFTTLWY